MEKRIRDLNINIQDMSITHTMQEGKVLLIVLDGVQGKAKVCEAVEHGQTIVETAKGKATRIKFEGSELI
ncbi:XtrA/YqaO family protein [Peribacillus tepidiphilus]|uniref:XtrA/YqaO family protein n=1 Tax=Peribacillus tepidiphilus TaxID=2652445 RepID=UPI001292529E|nr:XtrA/YqaO family protein [Peribacillus tepidiphilus]